MMWAAIINTVLGIWIIVAPGLLEYEKKAADNNYIVGPLVITFAIIAIWAVNRSARYFNIAFGLWLVLSPFILNFDSAVVTWNNVVVGLFIAGFSMIRGKIKGKYGGGWRSLIKVNNLFFLLLMNIMWLEV